MEAISSGNISMNWPDDDEIGMQRDGWSSGASGDVSGGSFMVVECCLSTSIVVFVCLFACLLGRSLFELYGCICMVC